MDTQTIPPPCLRVSASPRLRILPVSPRLRVQFSRLAKQQRRKGRQVSPPDHPGVGARGFDFGQLDAFALEPLADFAVAGEQAVFRSAGDPEQLELAVEFLIHLGIGLLEIGGAPPALNAPIQAKRSTALSPTNSDSAPPIDSPAMAREFRSVSTRYSFSTCGITSLKAHRESGCSSSPAEAGRARSRHCERRFPARRSPGASQAASAWLCLRRSGCRG